MMALVRICGQHRHAVERDLAVLGYDLEDISTSKLPMRKFVSIILASPPGTAVYHAETRTGPYTPEASLLASLGGGKLVMPGEDSATSSAVPVPAARGYDSLAELSNYHGVKFTAYDNPIDMLREREELAAKIRANKASQAAERHHDLKPARNEI